MPLLILAIFSAATFSGYALEMDINDNTSSSEAASDPLDTQIDIVAIDENANVVNIMENSNETALIEKSIEEQKMSSSGFPRIESLISPLIAIILIISIVYIKKRP